MRSCHHIQRAPRLRHPVYFVGSAPSPGTFCSSHPFFIPSRIGGDDEKHWSYSVGRRCHDVRDVFVCPEQRSVGQCEGTARSSSALQRLRHRAGWQGLDGLDWRSARPELSNDWSSHRPARCRSGEGSACDGNGQRSARATEAVFSPSNAGIASRLSRSCRGMCRPDRSGPNRDNGADARRTSLLEDRDPTTITMKPIDLNDSATTPIDPAVLSAMLPCLREEFGNSSPAHAPLPIRRNATSTPHELNHEYPRHTSHKPCAWRRLRLQIGALSSATTARASIRSAAFCAAAGRHRDR